MISRSRCSIQKGEIQGDKLTFEAQDNGRSDRHISPDLDWHHTNSESTVGGHISKVSLTQMKGGFLQVGGGFGDRSKPSVDDGGGAGQAKSNGVFKVGGGVSPPTLIHKTIPEYSEEAISGCESPHCRAL